MKYTDEQIFDFVEPIEEEITDHIVHDLDIVGRGFTKEFNRLVEEKVPELQGLGLNYYGIYCQFGPQ